MLTLIIVFMIYSMFEAFGIFYPLEPLQYDTQIIIFCICIINDLKIIYHIILKWGIKMVKAATLACYGIALVNLLISILDSNNYNLGIAILNYVIAMNLEKNMR